MPPLQSYKAVNNYWGKRLSNQLSFIEETRQWVEQPVSQIESYSDTAYMSHNLHWARIFSDVATFELSLLL